MRCRGIVSICFGLLTLSVGPAQAQTLTRETLLGRWCGTESTYIFTPTDLTVIFPNSSQQRVLHISSIDVDGPTIVVRWQEDSTKQRPEDRGKGSHTDFSNFSGNGMVQVPVKQGDGTMTIARPFHRC